MDRRLGARQKADDARPVKELERENRELKEVVADEELNIWALEEVARAKF